MAFHPSQIFTAISLRINEDENSVFIFVPIIGGNWNKTLVKTKIVEFIKYLFNQNMKCTETLYTLIINQHMTALRNYQNEKENMAFWEFRKLTLFILILATHGRQISLLNVLKVSLNITKTSISSQGIRIFIIMAKSGGKVNLFY